MKTFITILVFIFSFTADMLAQSVYVTLDCEKATIALYQVENKAATDILIHWVDKRYKANIDHNDGAWFRTNKEFSDFTICFADKEYMSDYNVLILDSLNTNNYDKFKD